MAVTSAGFVPAPVSYSAPVYHDAPVAYSRPVAYTSPVANGVEEYDAHPQYSFAYDVQDGLTGDSKSQQESRDGDVVQGSYSVVDPDGTKRIVDYTADPLNGFNAVVRKEAIGVNVDASVVAKVSAPVTYAAPVAKVASVIHAAPVAYSSAPIVHAAPGAYSAPLYHH